tara:strand:- start:41 stop:298 length:258 start_codon:yes stop_codon:yes gene_type:complete
MEMNMKEIKNLFEEYWYVALGVIVLYLLLFAPAVCNGVTYHTGIRGCDSKDNTGDNTADTANKDDLLSSLSSGFSSFLRNISNGF